MCSNQNNKKLEAGLKNSAISLTLGAIGIILVVMSAILYRPFFFGGAALLLAVAGLFLGAIGLNAAEKHLAITAIVVCFFALGGALLILG